MAISRRPCVAAERDEYRRIHHAAYHDAVEKQFGPWDEARQDRAFDNGWDDESHEALLLDGSLAGYCCVEHRPDDIHIRELVVDPQFQNQGIGTAVITDAIRTASERGVPVVLGTFIVNRAAQLYERLGFVEFDRTQTHRLYRWTPSTR